MGLLSIRRFYNLGKVEISTVYKEVTPEGWAVLHDVVHCWAVDVIYCWPSKGSFLDNYESSHAVLLQRASSMTIVILKPNFLLGLPCAE